PDSLLPDTSLCKTAERRPMPLGVILSEVSNANEIEGSRTADELARSPEDQRDEGSSSRKRSRYRSAFAKRFLVLQCSPTGRRRRAARRMRVGGIVANLSEIAVHAMRATMSPIAEVS